MKATDELRAILAKARRYLKSAEVLRLEQDYDSAISRLYYAMLYCAEALLLAKGLSFSSHRAVISAFARSFIRTNLLPRELHQWLVEGFEKRQVSDYEFLVTAGDAEVVDLAEERKKFVTMAQEFLQREGHL